VPFKDIAVALRFIEITKVSMYISVKFKIEIFFDFANPK